ncbi:MAG: hypothetical protein O6932_05600 [Gammaproteobacteria bacterium]|nr:hypothetical protein [Gammaproteobacteria bacterium]
MDIQRLLTSLSLKIIIQLGTVVALLGFAIAWNFDFIYRFYFENQQTQTGIIINTAIGSLMVIGMGNIIYHLFRYKFEEDALAGFVNNIESLRPNPLEGLPRNALVVKRFATMQSIQTAAGEINHSALSAMLTADEGTRFGLIKFINNILILTGVFGTIVSLSIALVGASDLIDSPASSLGGMGLVVHGMSTALSTTITAIVSYIIFGYFYTRLNDVQTHLISGIEHLTSVYLMPRFVKTSEDITNRMTDLIKAVILAGENLKSTQEVYHASALTLNQTISSNREQLDILSADLAEIKSLLRDGFRLPQSGSYSE